MTMRSYNSVTDPTTTGAPWCMSSAVLSISKVRCAGWWIESITTRPCEASSRRVATMRCALDESRPEVGSSSSSTDGAAKRACARLTRMRQPPDMSLVLRSMGMSLLSKPRPDRILRARGSAPVGSSSSSRSYSGARRTSSGPLSSRISMDIASMRAVSAITWPTTASTAVCSVGSASWCRWKTSTSSGSGTSRCAMAASTFDLPEPFSPISP
mmetsp:Transcript_13854/g.35258  ORF Transcript_13854/g.35258 Transcript_13854/m.35258 type:complete len:213 (-) Transcript_13854:409-1047(-)